MRKVTVWYVMGSAGSVWYGKCELGMMGCAALVCKEWGKAGILWQAGSLVTNASLYYKTLRSSVCLCVCMYVCSRTPPRPLDRLTSFLVERSIIYPDYTLSIFQSDRPIFGPLVAKRDIKIAQNPDLSNWPYLARIASFRKLENHSPIAFLL